MQEYLISRLPNIADGIIGGAAWSLICVLAGVTWKYAPRPNQNWVRIGLSLNASLLIFCAASGYGPFTGNRIVDTAQAVSIGAVTAMSLTLPAPRFQWFSFLFPWLLSGYAAGVLAYLGVLNFSSVLFALFPIAMLLTVLVSMPIFAIITLRYSKPSLQTPSTSQNQR